MQLRGQFLGGFVGRVFGLSHSRHVDVMCTEATSSECAFLSMPGILDEANEPRFGGGVPMGLPLSDISAAMFSVAEESVVQTRGTEVTSSESAFLSMPGSLDEANELPFRSDVPVGPPSL